MFCKLRAGEFRSRARRFEHGRRAFLVPPKARVKRQNVCFSRRVDLSDKMCAFLGVGWVVFGCVVLGLCSSCPAVSDGPGGVEVGVDAGVVDFRPAVG